MRQGGTQKGRDKLSWGKGGGLEGDVEGKEETERECVCVCVRLRSQGCGLISPDNKKGVPSTSFGAVTLPLLFCRRRSATLSTQLQALSCFKL